MTLLLTYPFIQYFSTTLLEYQIFQILIIVRNSSFMTVDTTFQLDDYTFLLTCFSGIMVKASEISPTFILSTTLQSQEEVPASRTSMYCCWDWATNRDYYEYPYLAK